MSVENVKVMEAEEVESYVQTLDPQIFEEISKMYAPVNPRSILKYIAYNFNDFSRFYKAYVEYINNPESFKGLPEPSNGAINLDEIPYLPLISSRTGSYEIGWLLLPDGSKILTKEFPNGDSVADKFKNLGEDARYYNCIIVPEIAKQFGIDSAEYFLADMTLAQGDERKRKRVCITPSFLKPGQELIMGHTLRRGSFSRKFSDISREYKESLEKRNFSAETIAKVESGRKEGEFLGLFVCNLDNLYNSGFIKGPNGELQNSPEFDYDYTLGVYKPYFSDRQVVADNWLPSIAFFINQNRNDRNFMNFVKRCIDNFNIDQIFSAVEEKHGVKLQDDVKAVYGEFIESQMSLVRDEYTKALDAVTPGELQ